MHFPIAAHYQLSCTILLCTPPHLRMGLPEGAVMQELGRKTKAAGNEGLRGLTAKITAYRRIRIMAQEGHRQARGPKDKKSPVLELRM